MQPHPAPALLTTAQPRLTMTLADVVGFTAGIFTTAANVPQVLKTYRMKSGEGLSFRMVVTLSLGLAMWVAYGLMTKAWPVVITNAVALGLTTSLVVMKHRYDR